MLWMQTERLMAVGRFQDAIDAAERIRAEAMACGEEDISGLARLYLGTIHHHDGNPQEAERHLDLLFAWLTAERQARLRASTGIDMLGTALAISALNRWFLGYPEEAVTRSTEAIESARVAGNTVGQAEAVILGASLLFYLRVDASRFGSMAELSEECRRLCLEHNIGTWRVYSEVLLGWQMTRLGDEMAGIQRIRRAIAEWQARGVVLGAGAYGVVLADACLAAALRRVDGDPADRGSLLNTGLEAISALFGPPRVPCGRSYDAELHRLRGELLLARDGLAASEEALDCFRHAEAIGRQQGALAWELRAAVSIVRLRQQQGQAFGEELAAARAALRDCYERFTEGFAFADLQDAAALIGPEEALPR